MEMRLIFISQKSVLNLSTDFSNLLLIGTQLKAAWGCCQIKSRLKQTLNTFFWVRLLNLNVKSVLLYLLENLDTRIYDFLFSFIIFESKFHDRLSLRALNQKHSYLLGEVTANTYCTSRTLPNKDTLNYSTDLRYFLGQPVSILMYLLVSPSISLAVIPALHRT